MPINQIDFDSVSEVDLRELVDAAVPEGIALEYKRDPYGARGQDKREFLKDMTSLANSEGGHLIIGIEEAEGVAERIVGIGDIDVDAEINRLESLLRDAVEPRALGVRMRAVQTADGVVVVIRVPRSLNPPHRVTSAGSNKFFVRNSGGVHEASVEELRALFTRTASIRQQIETFRQRRIEDIVEGRGPQQLPDEGRLVVHLVPLATFGANDQVHPEDALHLSQRFWPMAAGGNSPRFNIDGFINVRGGDECYGYTQVLRDGSVEATKAGIIRVWDDGRIVNAGALCSALFQVASTYFEGLASLGVVPPISVMISLQGVAGARLALPARRFDATPVQQFPGRDPLLMPEVVINEFQSAEDAMVSLRPALDALWNAAGFSTCTFYNEDGSWNQQPQ